MDTTLTSAQQAFLDDLKLMNTDHRAIQIVTAAFHFRNDYQRRAMLRHALPRPVEQVEALNAVVDKVAG